MPVGNKSRRGGAYQATQQDIKNACEQIMTMLPEETRILFSHSKLQEPLMEVLSRIAIQGNLLQPNACLAALGAEAERQAMAASLTMAAMPDSGTRKALALMVRAWTSLQETCVFGADE